MTHSLCPRHVGRNNYVPLFGVDPIECRLTRYYVIRDRYLNIVPFFLWPIRIMYNSHPSSPSVPSPFPSLPSPPLPSPPLPSPPLPSPPSSDTTNASCIVLSSLSKALVGVMLGLVNYLPLRQIIIRVKLGLQFDHNNLLTKYIVSPTLTLTFTILGFNPALGLTRQPTAGTTGGVESKICRCRLR